VVDSGDTAIISAGLGAIRPFAQTFSPRAAHRASFFSGIPEKSKKTHEAAVAPRFQWMRLLVSNEAEHRPGRKPPAQDLRRAPVRSSASSTFSKFDVEIRLPVPLPEQGEVVLPSRSESRLPCWSRNQLRLTSHQIPK